MGNVRVERFQAPTANTSWRTRTVAVGECLDIGFDPSTDDRDDFHPAPFTRASQWKVTRIKGMSGTLYTTDQLLECPTGQETSGSFKLNVMVKNLANTRIIGTTTLFAAG